MTDQTVTPVAEGPAPVDDRPKTLPGRILYWAVMTMGGLGALATLVLMIHVVLDVGLRYLANAPLPGTIEFVSYYWMVLITFSALALTQRRREHIDVSVLTELMPEQHRLIAIIATRTVSLIVVFLLAYYGWFHALEQMERREIAMGAVTVLIWPMRFLVPLGMGLFALQLLADLIDNVKDLVRGFSK